MTKVIYTPDSSGAFCGFLISFLRRIISYLGRTEFMGHLTGAENLHDITHKKVQVGKDQEKAQSEKDSHSKNRGGKKPN